MLALFGLVPVAQAQLSTSTLEGISSSSIATATTVFTTVIVALVGFALTVRIAFIVWRWVKGKLTGR